MRLNLRSRFDLGHLENGSLRRGQGDDIAHVEPDADWSDRRPDAEERVAFEERAEGKVGVGQRRGVRAPSVRSQHSRWFAVTLGADLVDLWNRASGPRNRRGELCVANAKRAPSVLFPRLRMGRATRIDERVGSTWQATPTMRRGASTDLPTPRRHRAGRRESAR